MPKLSLKTYKGARHRLTKVIERFEIATKNDNTPHTVRTLAYLHQVLQGYFKIDQDDRIEALEKFAEEGGFDRAKFANRKTGKAANSRL